MRKLPLHYQLTIGVVTLVLLLAVSFFAVALWSNQYYHNEATQKLHDSLAGYILDHQKEPLMSAGEVNHKALHQIAMQTMAINPLVEVYLLDTDGRILGYALPDADVKLNQVAMEPVRERLRQAPEDTGLVFGDNPRVPGDARLFSVAPLEEGGRTVAYLYVVLNSKVAESVAAQLSGSHVTQVSLLALVCLLLLAVIIVAFGFQRITQPLRKLSLAMGDFQRSGWMASESASGRQSPQSAGSEIDILSRNFSAMQQRIQSQFQHLQESSRLRRELISNISHDLRTPLASLQGYLEALYLKQDLLSDQEQRKYLGIAHRNSRRLATLIAELFELSKLEAGKVKPEMEPFSLLELVYDVVQDYELSVAEKQVTLKIDADNNGYYVQADIALIQRVLQNLIDNALRFTPAGGTIAIRLHQQQGKARVTVADTGFGIRKADLPHVFDAYYSTRHHPDAANDGSRSRGTGLGLAIVKRILELHEASIQVESEPGNGTLFRFELGAV